ncbi:MAG TPA: tetratricopeptide repeat protein [Armatimonadota bacterium]|jgi:Flp pilus assembly protein TadD
MTAFYCKFCGASVDETAQRCSACGKLLQVNEQDGTLLTDPQQLQVRQLLARARLSQQDGDLVGALRSAREALSLTPDCNTIHALLGQLYEQSGNASAAQYHFQAALSVTPSTADECPVEEIIPTLLSPRLPHGRWMGPLLLACVLVSGLAVLCSFRPLEHRHENSIWKFSPSRADAPSPRWEWKVKVPRQIVIKQDTSNQPILPPATAQPPAAILVSTNDRNASLDNPPEKAVGAEGSVLGPSLHKRVVAEPTAVSAEQADQAYFSGQYERAVTIYEKVIARDDNPSPRLYQDLAWCYQQLGNSVKAAENLDHAIQEYKRELAENPDSAVAQQGLRSCEAAYRTLMLSRDHSTP